VPGVHALIGYVGRLESVLDGLRLSRLVDGCRFRNNGFRRDLLVGGFLLDG
jgi:hypothetical protein